MNQIKPKISSISNLSKFQNNFKGGENEIHNNKEYEEQEDKDVNYFENDSDLGDTNLNKKKDEKDFHDIYQDPKQREEYKTLTIVRVKENHADLALQQLRIQLEGKTGWTKSKDNRLVIGNVPWMKISDFINKNTYFDPEYFNIKLKDNDNKNNNSVIQPFIGFSKQIFPNCIGVEEQSNIKWADIAYEFIKNTYKHCKWRTWRIQIVTPTSEAKVTNYRFQLRDMVLKKTKRFNSGLFTCYNFKSIKNSSLPIQEDEALVQFLCTDKKSPGYISIITPPIYKYLEKTIGVYPSFFNREFNHQLIPTYIHQLFSQDQTGTSQYGSNHIKHIKSYLDPSISLELEDIKSMTVDEIVDNFLPSRSFLKLFELFQKFPKSLTPFPPMRPNETVVDLGSSPGGWTLFSLLQGCRVTSIDKSPLDPKSLDCNDKNLLFLEMDAFEFRPHGDQTFDWLIIDMKVPPMKSLKLLSEWLKSKYCRNFIVNLKYQVTERIIRDHETFIINDISPKTSYINLHCLDRNGFKELTLFGISK
ncbi:hypothetical protein RB653_004260 [Dictyostelium firmibasis]|uniref:Ribosomal RNA methyltransferase FtsJ domain-containing protein n=1 Tax=Dictyostelium firmibasis TaxID=79012 RepID=A0AAN7UA82_9MYCE